MSLVGLMYSHRVQRSTFSAGAAASLSLVVQTGVGDVPAGARKFTVLRYGTYFAGASGGANADFKFTQGGDPLAGSTYMANSQAKVVDLGPQGVEFDISTTAVTFTVTSGAGTPTGWGIWLLGFWS
jgi:hypothetical protein